MCSLSFANMQAFEMLPQMLRHKTMIWDFHFSMSGPDVAKNMGAYSRSLALDMAGWKPTLQSN